MLSTLKFLFNLYEYKGKKESGLVKLNYLCKYRNNKGKLRDMAIHSILKSEFKEDF